LERWRLALHREHIAFIYIKTSIAALPYCPKHRLYFPLFIGARLDDVHPRLSREFAPNAYDFRTPDFGEQFFVLVINDDPRAHVIVTFRELPSSRNRFP